MLWNRNAKQEQPVPVYLINGFLESGKTDFISFTIAQDYFNNGERTLLVLCEEGEQEYEQRLLKKTNTVLELIEDEEDFTPDALSYLVKKNNCSRVVVEYNGMWNHKDIAWPDNFSVEQQITIIDASTFPVYYTNMRSMVGEMVKNSEMIMFNRCDSYSQSELSAFRRNLLAINQQAEIIFEGKAGEITLDEDLPYDVNADIIELNNIGYGVWYIEMGGNYSKYIGKKVTFLAQVHKEKRFPENYFAPGRMIMSCCADDIQFAAYPAFYENCNNFAEGTWIKVTAEITMGNFPLYKGGKGPILKVIDAVMTSEPKNPVIDFNNPD